MKFCNICDNFLWIGLDEDNKLQYQCKNCNNMISSSKQGSVCVLDSNYIDDNTNYRQYVSKYLKHDPTLPRVNNIKCTNTNCDKDGKDDEVIIVKYDYDNMKYMYHCVHCETFWKSN